MSTSFSANQYQDAFISKKLGNWENPKSHRDHPKSGQGFTPIIANDCGHLLDGTDRSTKNPWGNFLGTWDLPKRIPGNRTMVSTARTPAAQDKLIEETDKANQVMSGRVKNEQRQTAVKVAGVSQAFKSSQPDDIPLPVGTPEVVSGGACSPPADEGPQDTL